MSLSILLAQNVVVRDMTGYYRTIQAGINACPNGGSVLIYPGTYSGTNNVSLSWSGKNITVKPLYNSQNVIIDCQNTASSAFILNSLNNSNVIENLIIRNATGNAISLSNSNPKIKNCKLEYNVRAVSINNTTNQNEIEITNCQFNNNGNGFFEGGAIRANGNLNINTCSFTGNITVNTNDGVNFYYNPGAALYFFGTKLLLDSNTFQNNIGAKSGATVHVEAEGTSNPYVRIINNNFYQNSYEMGGLGYYPANCVTVNNTHLITEILIKNNIFNNNYGGWNDVYLHTMGTAISNCKYINNTHYNNQTGVNLEMVNQIVQIKNTIFDSNVASTNSSGSIKYSWFNGQNQYPTSFSVSNLFYGNPLLDSNTLAPKWNATQKSGLIDMADPDTDGDNSTWHTDTDDQDIDGTRLDIGAVPAHIHGAFTHQLSSQSSTDRYNWICLPYIDKLYTNTTPYDVDQLGYLLNTYHDNQLLATNPRILEEFNWNYNELGGISWMYPSFIGLPRVADSRHGYKVKLVSTASPKMLEVSGFLCGTYGNTNETMTVNAAPTGSSREIWVGYFKTQSEDPLYALSDIVGDLIEIKTKRWTMNRATTSDPWVYGSRTPLLNFGEAVSLTYKGTSNKNFVWHTQGGGSTESMAYTEPSVSNFSYTEQSDYTPIYVQLDAETKGNAKSNAELAIFVNDVCYGAEVIEGDIVQINAYINTLDLSNANVEFRYWEPGMKSEDKKYTSYAVYDHDDQAYQKRTLDFSDNQKFYQVSLDTKVLNNATLPKKSDLKGNFPNPFNPSTMIKYNIAEQGQVSLKIYNSKGQLVKQLVNRNQEAGYHSVEWNGTDNNGNKVPSGVYFYRLDTVNSSSTKKMMLIK